METIQPATEDIIREGVRAYEEGEDLTQASMDTAFKLSNRSLYERLYSNGHKPGSKIDPAVIPPENPTDLSL